VAGYKGLRLSATCQSHYTAMLRPELKPGTSWSQVPC